MSTTTTRETGTDPIKFTLSISLEIEGLNDKVLTDALVEGVNDLLS